MTSWPKIEYGHIFAYFITRPATYTQQELVSWKQMEAYNYYESGHVRKVVYGVWHWQKEVCCPEGQGKPE